MFNRRVGLVSLLALGAVLAPSVKIGEPALLPPGQTVENRRRISKKALARKATDPLAIRKHRAASKPAKKNSRAKSRKRSRAKVRMRSHRSRA